MLLFLSGGIAWSIAFQMPGPLYQNLFVIFGFFTSVRWTKAAFGKWRRAEGDRA